MSMYTWHNYGYGLCTDSLNIKSVESLQKLISLAPEFESEFKEFLKDNAITNPTIDEILSYDEDDGGYELAYILSKVIYETENVEFTACDDYECRRYLMYQPEYPWNMSSVDKEMTIEKLDEILNKYISIVTDDKYELGFVEAENGG